MELTLVSTLNIVTLLMVLGVAARELWAVRRRRAEDGAAA
jgi:hypothetical protein